MFNFEISSEIFDLGLRNDIELYCGVLLTMTDPETRNFYPGKVATQQDCSKPSKLIMQVAIDLKALHCVPVSCCFAVSEYQDVNVSIRYPNSIRRSVDEYPISKASYDFGLQTFQNKSPAGEEDSCDSTKTASTSGSLVNSQQESNHQHATQTEDIFSRIHNAGRPVKYETCYKFQMSVTERVLSLFPGNESLYCGVLYPKVKDHEQSYAFRAGRKIGLNRQTPHRGMHSSRRSCRHGRVVLQIRTV